MPDTPGARRTESPGARVAAALGDILRRSTRARLYGQLTAGLGDGLDEATYPVVSGLARWGPRSAAQLAQDVDLDRTVVSRYASRLEAGGLLLRRPDPRDRRATLLALTDAGAEAVATMRDRLHGLIDGYLATWPEAAADQFADDFARFVADGPFSDPGPG